MDLLRLRPTEIENISERERERERGKRKREMLSIKDVLNRKRMSMSKAIGEGADVYLLARCISCCTMSQFN